MRLSRSRVPVVVGILAVAAAAVAVVPSSAHAAPAAAAAPAVRLSSSGRAVAVLPSIIPTWAKTAKVLGATPDNQQVIVSLAMAGKDPAGEAAYAKAVTTPGNALYRQWLTVDEFKERYGAIDGEAAAVVAALKVLGVTNVMTDKLGLSVMMAIPASTASALFGVSFHQVMHGGQSTRVATNELSLPASLLPYIVDVAGLTQERVHTDHTAMEKVSPPIDPALPASGAPPAYFNAGPTSTYYGSNLATDKPTYPILSGDTSTTKPYNTSGYTPPQLRGAYGVDQVSETGKGVTAGVVLFYDGPDVGSDLQTFSTAFGLAAPSYTDLSIENEGVTIVGGSAPVLDPVDAEGEQTLDVEAIHQMAPDASIVYSGAIAPEDPAIYVAEDTAMVGGAQVINNSYGGTGDTDSADATMFADEVTEPAMTLGVGIDFSSGDAADNVAANGEREADFPATSDEVTAVGGTGLEVGATNNYEGEFYWGTYSSPALGPPPAGARSPRRPAARAAAAG